MKAIRNLVLAIYFVLLIGSPESLYGQLSAPSMSNGYAYKAGYDMYIYFPRGYTQAAPGSLPLMIFGFGYGPRDTWANALTEGLPQFLNSGSWDDLTYGCIVVMPQYKTADTDYTDTGHLDPLLTYLTAQGIKYDPNRVYMTGLSGGAIWCHNTAITRQSTIACVVPVAGPAFNNGTILNGLGFWHYQGTADGTFNRTVGGSLYWANGGFSAWIDLTPAPRGTYFYSATHSTQTWDSVYNPSKMKTNFFQYATKFSKDKFQQATLFTANAEKTLALEDYRESKMLVDRLDFGDIKTYLQIRLKALYERIRAAGSYYHVSTQTSGLGALNQGYNIWTSFATGNGITNIKDINGINSTIGFTMTTQCYTTTPDGNTSSNNAKKMKAHGLDDYRMNIQGFLIEAGVNNGRVTISGIPTGKLTDIYIYHHHIASDDDAAAMGSTSLLNTTINSVTKSQYSAYANSTSINYTGVAESSGNIVIDLNAAGASRTVVITGIDLKVY